ncbi:NADP-dependent oxidoreductase [Phenylobacterium montanum]|uniref:NADP-dependent oxidoreductase n=1 Tax=Phenylobacterium montanum TaxID=2823693 RepID=A0A975IWW7_9CAUL|nr:NADP-dependent oxidoreductase [Caulobacter sp. S6]QUD90512.1 NADP-dependent oxidoreductase [Caulobacter sp. S6]
MSPVNRQWLINGRPNGRPLQDDDFKWVETAPREPAPGEALVRTLALSFDPAQKGWMENIGGYVAPTEIGEVMRGSGVGEVVASNAPGLAVGDKVTGMLGWQDYATLPAKDLTRVPGDELLTANLGVLGTTGMTAFFGLNKIGKPFPGDTLVVTGAAGATGSVVGQIGKLAGCRVIGVAGGEAKCRWLVDELGFDAAVDYKAGSVRQQLKDLAPQGVDILWDNVGGSIFNDLLAQLALHARVVVCGGISRYELGKMPAGPENYFNLIFKRAHMEGFIVLDYASEYPWARERIAGWIRQGRLRYKEDVQHGLENAPRTLMRLFAGENFGKQLLKIA